MERLPTRLVLALLVLLAAGCPAGSGKSKTDGGPSAGRPGPSHVAWQQAKIDHARLTALAANRAAYQKDLEHKYVRMWEGLDIERQIPYEPAVSELRAALEEHASEARLRVVGFEAMPIPPRIPDGRRIPAELGPDDPFSWHPDELVGRTRVRLELAPSDLERLEAWFRSRGRVGRRLRVEEVSLGAERATAVVVAYHFHRSPPQPVRRQSPLDPAAVLAQAGVGEGAEDSKTAEVRRLYGEIAGQLDAINEALGYRQQAELWDARYAYFFALVQDADAQRWSQVLR